MWLHDSAGDIYFYQMSLSQSESTISHESIIFRNRCQKTKQFLLNMSEQDIYQKRVIEIDTKSTLQDFVLNLRTAS